MNKSIKEINELISTEIMGFTCNHVKQHIPDEILVGRIQDEFEDERGVPCTREYAMTVVEWDRQCDVSEIWCSKCHYERVANAPKDTGTWMVKNYLKDIAAAWKIVDKLHSDGYMMELTNEDNRVGVLFWLKIRNTNDKVWDHSAAYAICMAALKLKGIVIND